MNNINSYIGKEVFYATNNGSFYYGFTIVLNADHTYTGTYVESNWGDPY